MNARGRQFALAGTLDGWARLESVTARQRRALRRSFVGLEPRVYSRYGHRQWAAPLPWTRRVVKDPFAMLSVPTVARATGARPLLIYRHPGAMLVSYRRMGWEPDLEEIRPIVQRFNAGVRAEERVAEPPAPGQTSAAEAMGRFWNVLYAIALHDLRLQPDTVVLAHEEIARGGLAPVERLFGALGLAVGAETTSYLAGGEDAPRAGSGPDTGELHRFGRDPKQVADSWRGRLAPDEIAEIEDVTRHYAARMAEARTDL